MAGTKTERAPRADAARNRDAIIDAALERLNAKPSASVAEIAAAAGISRITFYGHFSSREELLDAVLARMMERIQSHLNDVDSTGAPWPALERLLQVQWRLVDQLSGLVRVGEQEMPAERIHELHAGPIARVHALIDAGRKDGTFRTDHTLNWQITCFFAVLHGAASEFRMGRLTEEDAERVIPETVLAMLKAD